MAKLSIQAGATSQTINVFIQDSSSTTGAGLTGLVYNTASLVAYYALPKAAAVSITLATLAAVTSAYSSGGFKEIDATNMPGWYRFDIPDAAIASGRFVALHFKGATNMAPLPVEIELTAWNNQDAVRGGLTALPNANAEASGGLYTRGTGAGQINQDANGRIDANVKTWIGGTIPAVNVTGVPLVDLKYALGTISPAAAGYVALDWGQITNKTTTNALTGTTISTSQIAASVTAGVSLASTETMIIRTSTATAGAAGSITLDASASATDNIYRGQTIKIVSGTGAGQTRVITGYTGSTQVATVDENWQTNPSSSSVFVIQSLRNAKVNSSLETVAASVTGSVTVGTNSDKTGYSLSQTFPTNFSSLSIDGSGRVDVIKINGTSQTARDIGASVLLSSGSGTGQLDFTSGVVKSNLTQVSADTDAPTHLLRAVKTTVLGTVSSGSNATNINTSSLLPAASVADQFKGRILTFDRATTTANLRGQSMPIAANTNTGIITLSSALTDAPASGDTFSIT